jgi:hypothetical protein
MNAEEFCSSRFTWVQALCIGFAGAIPTWTIASSDKPSRRLRAPGAGTSACW